MSEEVESEEEEEKKSSKLPLVIGLVLALIGGGGGFFATWSGMILAPPPAQETAEEIEPEVEELPDVAFVAVEPLTIGLRDRGQDAHLRFRAHLEVKSKYQSDVETLLPRVSDVMNSYLRALKTEDFEEPTALTRVRSQLLRRIQIVTGEGRVNDLLIMEFVIS